MTNRTGRSFNLYIDKKLADKLEALAKADYRSPSNYISMLIQKELKRIEDKDKCE